MGWSIGFDDNWNRDIGYGVPAHCDHPKCRRKIDRGLAYVCGGEPYGGDKGCGLYFCEKHLWLHDFIDGDVQQVCWRCDHHKQPYKPKPEHKEWMHFKMKDPSWSEWRKTLKETSMKMLIAVAVAFAVPSLAVADCPRGTVEYKNSCYTDIQPEKDNTPSVKPVSNEKPSRHPQASWERGEVNAVNPPSLAAQDAKADQAITEANAQGKAAAGIKN